MHRWGITLPFGGLGLAGHREIVQALPSLGYTDVWSSEVAGADAFTPLAAAAAWQPELRLGTAIVPAFTRGPALIAQSAAAMASLAPGRFSLGIGASSPAIVEQWNGIEFSRPFQRTRDVLRMVRAALAGERITGGFSTFDVSGFRLELPPPEPVQVLLAALRPRMLTLAGAEADGVILNWLASQDVGRCLAAVNAPQAEVVARIFVCPTEDAERARAIGRRLIAGYLTVDAYAEFHRWLGRGDQLDAMWRLWDTGDRAAAAAAVPDAVVDALVLHGSPHQCRAAVRAYVDAGVTVPVIALLPVPELADGGLSTVLRGLAPASDEQGSEAP